MSGDIACVWLKRGCPRFVTVRRIRLWYNLLQDELLSVSRILPNNFIYRSLYAEAMCLQIFIFQAKTRLNISFLLKITMHFSRLKRKPEYARKFPNFRFPKSRHSYCWWYTCQKYKKCGKFLFLAYNKVQTNKMKQIIYFLTFVLMAHTRLTFCAHFNEPYCSFEQYLNMHIFVDDGN